MLFVSTRQRFQHGDPHWESYISWIGLPQLREVRTVDAKLNEYVNDCGSRYCEQSEIESVLKMLPTPSSPREYYLLATKVDSESRLGTFDGFDFLGCDLSDETMTSSVLNCGPWTGLLQPFVRRLNQYGLLSSVEDARKVASVLPHEWGADPHASADVWAIFGKGGQ